MTLREAVTQHGYIYGDCTYSRGYVSRKIDNYGELDCHIAGGSRHGQLYVNIPCWHSTRYHIRQYLIRVRQAD